MLHGQRDRLLQKHLYPPYGEVAAIRNARTALRNGRAVPNAECAASCWRQGPMGRWATGHESTLGTVAAA